ncbi:hypothetical protein BTVI_06857 [Pitangus sulphuratus]|nr:hypothetical protein BTVI_06857 [Pitangus sulphuratus]
MSSPRKWATEDEGIQYLRELALLEIIYSKLRRDDTPKDLEDVPTYIVCHLQYIDDIIVWEDTVEEVFEKGKKIIQILLRAGLAIKKSKVKGPARESQFLGVKWQDGHPQIPTEVINKITGMAPLTSKKETQAFLGIIGFWRMHIPEYSQIPGIMVLPGASGKRFLVRPKADDSDSGAKTTEDQKPTTPPQRRRSWQLTEEYKQPQR